MKTGIETKTDGVKEIFDFMREGMDAIEQGESKFSDALGE